MVISPFLEALIYGVRDVFSGATQLVRKSQLVFRNNLVASVVGDQIIVDAQTSAGLPITSVALHGTPRPLTAFEHGNDGTQDILCCGSDFALTPTKTWDAVQFAAKTSLDFFTLDGSAFELTGGAFVALTGNSMAIEGASSPPSIAAMLGNGVAVFFFATAQVVPNANPSGGIILYVEGDTLKYRKPSGAIVRLSGGPAIAVSAFAIDWALSGVYTKTLAAGANAFTFANDTDGDTIVVVVTGAASTLAWPTVAWAGGVAPTQTATGTDVYTFVKAGTTIYGSVVQNLS